MDELSKLRSGEKDTYGKWLKWAVCDVWGEMFQQRKRESSENIPEPEERDTQRKSFEAAIKDCLSQVMAENQTHEKRARTNPPKSPLKQDLAM